MGSFAFLVRRDKTFFFTTICLGTRQFASVNVNGARRPLVQAQLGRRISPLSPINPSFHRDCCHAGQSLWKIRAFCNTLASSTAPEGCNAQEDPA
jgi:hypothetical protein